MMATSEKDIGPGEARTRQRRRRMFAYYGVSGIVGASLGFGLAMVEQGEGNFIRGDLASLSLDPLAAVIVAIGFAIGLFAIPLWGYTQIDEHQLKQNLIGMAGGCMAVIAGYPIWAVLAMGGFLPLPSAIGVFLLAFATMALTFGVLKLRG
ncbi:hypothetical protein G6N82_01460 [Altererythrobacter sp. BO-6]|uniref:hypothetical protein n=1 Tax=Altererythrobacter sp. BO-6 TaxID=2604537 RepID=UPI0013E1B076|nr:hypothetical protein [Altererythrobacter sp. BO-6]QIG53003.1 hypothetical protein G6N82_01460 [Altererythrobacter sp. BO-6]